MGLTNILPGTNVLGDTPMILGALAFTATSVTFGRATATARTANQPATPPSGRIDARSARERIVVAGRGSRGENSEELNPLSRESTAMKQLIIHGDPGIRKGAIINYDGEELVCFGINRNGEWHGPEEVQLWCTVGTEDEYGDYEKRNFTPHFLDVDRVDAAGVDVVRPKGDLAV